MAEVIKTYIEKFPAQKFIGITYSNKDRDEKGTFGAKWDEWIQNGYFDIIKKENPDCLFDSSTYACMRLIGNTLEYSIGLIAPISAHTPEGYESVYLPEGNFGVCWFKGSHKKADIYFEQDKCEKALIEAGMEISPDSFFFERYVPERFTEDVEGNVILDFCILTPA